MSPAPDNHRVPGGAETIGDVLLRRSREQGDDVAFRFLKDGKTETATFTYAQLQAAVDARAADLLLRGAAGARVGLVYGSCPEFIVDLFSCFAVGAIAVPLAPPRPRRRNPLLEAVVADTAPRMILTSERLAAPLREHLRSHRDCAVVTEEAADERAPAGDARAADQGGEVAYLQYTSGTTSQPKGVRVSHANIMHNVAAIAEMHPTPGKQIVCSWLPFFHDMGLVGTLLFSISQGAPLVFMPPESFLMHPVLWLEAICKFRVTRSAAPNFAYDLCVQRTTPEERAALDLSCWQLSVNGGEAVRLETLERFHEAFATSKLRPGTVQPCFGLAESTLLVTGTDDDKSNVTATFCRDALTRGEVHPAEGGAPLVGCGHARGGQEVRIVDPATSVPSAPDRVGEIWVRGPSVADGYWNRPAETRRDFGGVLEPSGEAGFLRTGDLGFFYRGSLFVAGRLREMIILGGRNLHAADIEETVEAAHPAVRRGGAAAFAIPQDGTEALAIVVETRGDARRAGAEAAAELTAAVRRAVVERHDATIGALKLVPAGAIPKTTSGKKRRTACRHQWFADA